MITSRLWKVAFIAVAVSWVAFTHFTQQRTRQQLEARVVDMARLKWVGYAPTHYDPRRSIFPSKASIRSDLETLKAIGFDGIITYESGGPLADVPLVATDIGLRVIQGIWAPVDRDELRSAIALKNIVAGYCVGNEGLGTRYSLSELDQGATYLANHVDVPVAISEQIHVYFERPELLHIGDWLFPIVHPHFGNAKTVADALAWVEVNTSRLRQLAVASGASKPLFIKEIGMPSAGDAMYSELEQARFLGLLWNKPHINFAVFEAFDRRGWEYISPVEPHWGLFHSDRLPKRAVGALAAVLDATADQ